MDKVILGFTCLLLKAAKQFIFLTFFVAQIIICYVCIFLFDPSFPLVPFSFDFHLIHNACFLCEQSITLL
jgi:hypothetical protein